MHSERDLTLDSFRAFFIIAVVAFHYLVAWAPPFNKEDIYGFDRTFSPYFALGKLGVECFFVISGIFITVTVLRSSDALDFAYRRMSRIYPALLIATTFTYLFVNTVGIPVFQVTPVDFVASIALISTHIGRRFVDGAYWSLAVEVKFYAWVGILFWMLRGKFWIGLIGLQIVGAISELISVKIGKAIFIAPYMPFFLCGTAVAYQAFLKQPKAAVTLYAFAAVFFVLHWTANPVTNIPLIVSNLAIIGVVLSIVAAISFDFRITRAPLARVGLVSYEIYLLHQNVGVTLISSIKSLTEAPDLAVVATVCGIVYAMAEALHFVSERIRRSLNVRYYIMRPRPLAA